MAKAKGRGTTVRTRPRPAVNWQARAERAEEEVLVLRDRLAVCEAELATLKPLAEPVGEPVPEPEPDPPTEPAA